MNDPHKSQPQWNPTINGQPGMFSAPPTGAPGVSFPGYLNAPRAGPPGMMPPSPLTRPPTTFGNGPLVAPPPRVPAPIFPAQPLSGPVIASSDTLPVPYHGKGIYSHTTHVGPPSNLTPSSSEPSSLNNSRVPSPAPFQQIDALEGQFRTGTPSSRDTPPSGSPVPPFSMSPKGVKPVPSGASSPSPLAASATLPVNQLQGAPAQTVGGFQLQSGLNMQYGMPRPTYMSQPPVPPPSQQYMSQPPVPPTSQQFMTGQLQQPPGGPILQQPQNQLSFQQHGQTQHPPMVAQQPMHYQPQPNLYQSPPQQPHTMTYQQPPGQYSQPMQQTPSQLPPMQNMNSFANQFGNLNIQNQIPLEMRSFNLLQERNILPADCVKPPQANLPEHLKRVNCSPDIFRCTLTSIPQSSSLLQKARLPLGILIHPFKDLSNLPVIQSSVIVRCKSCRTYINPFVSFLDQRRWRCNLCFRANELPEEFNFDPVTKSYGSPERRPEIKSATIEFVAPSEYMLRPPQPCVYIFLLDVSYHAVQSGYLQSFCEVLSEELDKLPGDTRTMIGFITYNSNVHFYNLSESLTTPQMLTVSDVDEIFLPLPDGLLANLSSSRALVEQFLEKLPSYHQDDYRDDSSALGASLQAALKLLTPTGGRVTVMQSSLPNCGPGKLQSREDPNQRATNKPANLQPATDFYKVLSLEAAGHQIAIDMFLLNSQYADYATLGGAARHSGGSIYSYPSLHSMHNPAELERFEDDLKRYLTRKIGLEAVMRVRCTKGLTIHTFHGNFFVRSTDLLSLPNVNPDAGFGMQVSIEENLTESPYACMQAALLYTSSKGERRIRVHTLCLPVSTSISDIINGADQQAIACLLAKMAVDRSINSSVTDAREALVNACSDALTAYSSIVNNQQKVGILAAPYCLRLLPLYTLAILKYPAFRLGISTKEDDRVFAMDECKGLPLFRLMQKLVPDLYPVHALTDEGAIVKEDITVPQPPRLQLSSSSIDRHGAFILDVGEYFYMWIGANISPEFCEQVFKQPDFMSLPSGLVDLPELQNPTSERLRAFIGHLQDCRPNLPPIIVIKEGDQNRHIFVQCMIEDRQESSMSYYEFLQHIQKQIKS